MKIDTIKTAVQKLLKRTRTYCISELASTQEDSHEEEADKSKNKKNSKLYDIETSITLDYRKFHWGIERIVLDGIQNHLPSDSKGTITTAKFKQEGVYVDFRNYDNSKPVEEIVFEDNGSGYDAGLLSLLFSPKAADVFSAGQFGEGLKLVASAALRHGIQMEYRSRNWIAKPYATSEVVAGHSIRRLCFHVKENGDYLEGSRTVFFNPPHELIDEILQMKENVLIFNTDYEVFPNLEPKIESTSSKKDIYKSILFGQGIRTNKYPSKIIDLKAGKAKIFVKGIKLQELDSIFSYDLGIDDITPDRAFGNRDVILEEIRGLLADTTNSAVIKRILGLSTEEPHTNYLEFSAFAPKMRGHLGFPEYGVDISYMSHKRIDLDTFEKFFGEESDSWKLAFYELFGENAVISSEDTNRNNDAKILAYTPVKLNRYIAEFLNSRGVKSADQIQLEQEYRWIPDDELSDLERNLIGELRKCHDYLDIKDATPVIKIYSGLYTTTGRELESSKGAHKKTADGTSYIALKRTLLLDPIDATHTYIHELGHMVTGKGDFDRAFVDFFVTALTKVYMSQCGHVDHMIPTKNEKDESSNE
jgi:hypothetical protein